jgi:hypothetical protein
VLAGWAGVGDGGSVDRRRVQHLPHSTPPASSLIGHLPHRHPFIVQDESHHPSYPSANKNLHLELKLSGIYLVQLCHHHLQYLYEFKERKPYSSWIYSSYCRNEVTDIMCYLRSSDSLAAMPNMGIHTSSSSQ